MIYQGNTPEAYAHFKLVREDGAYRNFLMLEEMRAEMEPAWGILETEETPVISHQDIGYRQLNDRFDRWMGKVNYLENRLNEHLDKKKSNKYISYKED